MVVLFINLLKLQNPLRRPYTKFPSARYARCNGKWYGIGIFFKSSGQLIHLTRESTIEVICTSSRLSFYARPEVRFILHSLYVIFIYAVRTIRVQTYNISEKDDEGFGTARTTRYNSKKNRSQKPYLQYIYIYITYIKSD